ncbi:DUF5960 family protein [Streptococcus gordonii]|uniref:DUF5960 family protein n=1 Tax=Streptococcus gordonii TaxID=1302 RepID=UPI00076A7213|nr:DUF5960 family protein [Streptococcus gordonii]MBZ2133453.1 hypothetical protein [Streptococcus gordonii]MBZ2141990.1 hypothetical protein [Streptococcus gordonii]MBZ2144722.1 hypothetical protein [Streptococcus gordonii]MBZ2146975.1 hypothetical protein [Streptococcus gordonii]
MTTQNVHEELQFDYFSQNYYQFQEDFYQFSNLPQPLMVMEDDILRHMASRQVTYFKLSKAKSLDQKDHYFHFTISRPDQTKRLCIYHYQGQTEDINY